MKKIYSYFLAITAIMVFGQFRGQAQCFSPSYAASGNTSVNVGTPISIYSGRDANGIHGYYIDVFVHAGYQYQIKQYLYSGCCGQILNTAYYLTFTDSANNVLQSSSATTYTNFSSKVARTVRVHVSHSATCTPVTQSSFYMFYLDVTPTALCPHSYRDLDGDGYGNPLDSLIYDACPTPTTGYVTDNTDCDDNDSLAHMIQTWYMDADSDGYGDMNDVGTLSCGAPSANHVLNNTDCDDGNILAYSSATWYTDADGDGFGANADPGTVYCGDPNARVTTIGLALSNNDCDDNDPMIGPASPEIYGNSIDENCDGETVLNENALDFNGSTFVQVPHSSSINLGHEFTIEAMINPASVINQTIIDKGNYDFCFQVFNGNLGYYNLATQFWFQSTLPIVTNQWQHVALVHFANDSVAFFIDGNYAGSAVNTGFAQDNGVLRIGEQSPISCACNRFNGMIDEVRLWNVSRTPQQINDNKSNSLCAMQTGLGAYYKFNVGIPSGNNTGITTVEDHSGNGNTGSLNNFTLNGAAANFVQGDTLLISMATTTATASLDTVCSGDTLTLAGAGGVNYIWSNNVTNGSGFVPATTATYYMLGVDANGCANYDSTTVVVQNCQVAQSINFPAIATMYLGDPDFVLNATATSGLPVSYVSSDPLVATIDADTVTIVGVGTTTITASQAGNSSFYAAADEQQILTVLSPVGLNTVIASGDIKIYPNPAHDVLNIKLGKSFVDANVKIVSIIGTVVYDKAYTSEIISTENFAAGVYNVVITSADKVEVRKITIQ